MSPTSNPARRSLRIGIDGRELEGRPTGVGRYLRSLLRQFAENEQHSFVVYASSDVSLPLASKGMAVKILPLAHSVAWEQRRLPAALMRDRMDVLLSPAYSCPLVTATPRVTAIHDLSFFARPAEFGFVHGLRRRLMARGSATVSSRILVCSEFTKAQVLRYLGPKAFKKTEVVLLGADDDLPKGPSREESRSNLGLTDDTAYILTVGTVLKRRNVSLLVRAFARLRESRPGLRLGIIGENRSHPFEDLAALSRSLGCESGVQVSGFVSDAEIVQHYAAADVAVFLSEYEGFGLPALEALSRGVPTIIADRGSLNEMFAVGAMAIEPNLDSVTDALNRVLDDKEVAATLSRRGSERARAFSWKRAAQQTLEALESAAA